uniref:aldehyde dehydrogenase (NAD(+)) n=1 Tax=Cacopsylla melanoneura TaxID=428564 RepID=A0A8D9EDJ1_9HEMI
MARNISVKFTKLFINNAFVDAVSGKTFPTINPATETKITDVAEADKADVDRAVEAAKSAFKRGSVWRNLDASARGKLIYKLAELIDSNVPYLASLESLDNGKPYEDSVFDLGCASDTFRYFAGWCDKIEGSTIPSAISFSSRWSLLHLHSQGTRWYRGTNHSLELPGSHARLEMGPCPGRRLSRCAQAGRTDSAYRPLCGESHKGGRIPRRCNQCTTRLWSYRRGSYCPSS